METRTVYRVEHADHCSGPFAGEGCFTLSGVMEDAGAAFNDYFHEPEAGFPGPANDRLLKRRWRETNELEDYVCGCRDEAQLARWFPEPLADWLDERGYEVTVWRVPCKRVAYGSAQVMFDRDAAECIARRPVSSLHEEDE